MEYLVFRSTKSGNAVILPAAAALVVARKERVAVYAVAGNGRDPMVWELSSLKDIETVDSYAKALANSKMTF